MSPGPSSLASEPKHHEPGVVDDSTDSNGPPSPAASPAPPDGGLKAWTQVFMGHLVLINGWGYLSSFGLFQSYYTTLLSATPSAISWIGSAQIFLVYLVGTFSGRALDAGYYHTVLTLGSFMQVLGVFMSSVSTQYWQLFLTQGICKGLGDGLVFCPTVSLVATYFSKKRSLAMAFTASGGATGGIIFPLVAQQLLPKVGFGWTVRTMGFIILFNAAIIVSIARVRLSPRKVGPIVEWSAFKEPSYTLFCIGMFFNLWAVYFAYFYVSSSLYFEWQPRPDRASLTQVSGQHVRQNHHPRLRLRIPDAPPGYERCRNPGTVGVRPHCRPSPRSHQHPRSRGIPRRPPILLLGGCVLGRRAVRLLRDLRFLRRRHTEPFPCLLH